MRCRLIRSTLLISILTSSFAVFAQSNLKIAGTTDVFVGSIKYAGTERQNKLGSGGMTTSWLGFSGSENLGNGLKLGFALDGFLRMDTGAQGRFDADTTYSRNANLSLSGAFGAIKLGRSGAPNFVPSMAVNPFGGSFPFSPLIQHMDMLSVPGYVKTVQADTGWSNQVVYSTPKLMGGLSINLHYQFSNLSGNGKNKNNVGLSGAYSAGPFMLTGFYEQVELSNPKVSLRELKSSHWMLGGSYDFAVVKGFFSYGYAKDMASKGDDAKTIQLGASVPMGQGKVLASYAQTNYDPSVTNMKSKRKTLSVGYDHSLSKRTDIYTVIMNDRATGLSSGTSFAVGLRHHF